MAPQDNADTDLEGRYTLPATPIHSRVTELANVLGEFLGAGYETSGSATRKGPPDTTKRYQSLDEWSSAVATAPARGWLTLESVLAPRRITLFLDEYGMQVKVMTKESDVDVARDVLRRIEVALALEAEEELSQGGRASAEREYLFQKPASPAPLMSFLESSAATVGANPRTWISVRMRDDAAVQLKGLADPRLATILDTRWADIIGVDCELEGKRTSVRTNFGLDESTLRLRVEAASAEKVKEHIESLESVAALEPLPKDSTFKGRSRLFQPRAPLDAEWFARATTALASAVPSSKYTNCRYRLVESPNEEIVNRDYQQWSAEVLKQLDHVANASCWLDGRVAHAGMRIDPRREQVEITIEATTEARAEAIIAGLVRDLDLEVVRDASPNRRTAGTYDITGWGNKQFAKALEAALKRVFGDRVPAIEDAYIEELVGDEVDRRKITDLGTLLKRLKEPEPFGGMGLRAVARDDAIGVYLTPAKAEGGLKRLELKSSFEPKVFPDLVSVFDRVLSLEPIASPADDGGEPAAASGKAKGFDWRASFLPILFTGAVTLLATSTFWLAVIPSTSLEITVPVHRADSSVVMPVGLDSVRVEWVIRRKRFGQTTVLRNESASVRVLRSSGQEIHSTTGSGKVAVPVVSGEQTIEVSTPSGNESDVLRIIVPASPPAPATPSNAPAASRKGAKLP